MVIESEQKAIPSFEKDIRCFNSDERLKEVLRYMREHEFSQVVVRKAGKLGLVSTEGIVKWLTETLLSDNGHIGTRTVGEVVRFEKPDTFQIMGPETPVSKVRAAFLAPDRPKLVAVIITSDGTPRGKPIGFVDPWDMLLTFSKDFRVIRWRGHSFRLTRRQGKVVQILYRAWEHGEPDLPDSTICAELGTEKSRLKDTFRKSKAWNFLILEGEKPGTRRLNL